MLEVSTDSGTTWKSMICELSNTLSMSTEMSSTQTKCDGGVTISTPGAKSWEISGEAVVDTAPTASQVSYEDALGWWSNATAVLVRIQHDGTGTNFYHSGTAYLTSLELSANVTDAVQFSFSFTGNGSLDISA